jgi:hypothetical protein
MLGLKLSGYATDRRRGTNTGKVVSAMSSPLLPTYAASSSYATTLGVAVIFLVLGTPPVLDVVALTLLALHDPVDAAWRTVLIVVVEAMSQLSLLALAVTLVDVTVGIVTVLVLVEVGM